MGRRVMCQFPGVTVVRILFPVEDEVKLRDQHTQNISILAPSKHDIFLSKEHSIWTEHNFVQGSLKTFRLQQAVLKHRHYV